MKNWLEKQFRLSEFNTNIKTELLAGLTTFVTMAYVLATIPNILAGAGYDKHTTLTAMIILIIVTSCAMALVTNRPFALAPGLGSVGIIASMITNEGVSMPIAAGVIFWSGVLFIIITASSASSVTIHSSCFRLIRFRTLGSANLEKMIFFSSGV